MRRNGVGEFGRVSTVHWLLAFLLMLLAGDVGSASEPDGADRVTPSVTVTRRGRLLQLDYKLLNAAGVDANVLQPNRTAPTFTVLKNGREIGSGTFEYG